MKKIKLTTETEVTLDSLTDASIVGFVDGDGKKGHVVFVLKGNGDRRFMAVSRDMWKGELINSTYGDRLAESVKEALRNIGVTCSTTIREAYLFSTKKELFTWLAED